MSGVKDVSELKDVVILAAKIVNGAEAALKDGKIGLDDANIVFGLVQPLITAISGAGDIPAEIADFQADEAVELVAAVAAELVIDNEKAKKVVAASLDLIATSVPKIAALVEACKA